MGKKKKKMEATKCNDLFLTICQKRTEFKPGQHFWGVEMRRAKSADNQLKVQLEVSTAGFNPDR